MKRAKVYQISKILSFILWENLIVAHPTKAGPRDWLAARLSAPDRTVPGVIAEIKTTLKFFVFFLFKDLHK